MTLRYLGTSAFLHLLAAPLSYRLWSTYIASGRVARGDPVGWDLWGLVAVYFVVPFVAGLVVGKNHESALIKPLSSIKSPTGWDHLFARKRNGWVKMKLKSGEWIGGWFGPVEGDPAFAASYPHPRELYLPKSVELDQTTGAFVVDATKRPTGLGPGILVGWEEIEYLKFVRVE